MKKNIFIAMAAVVVMLFTSCSKDIELPGTKWKANYSKTLSYQGVDASVNMNFLLNFTNATQYSLTTSGTMSAMGMTQNMDSETTTGTYTFDGEKGVFDGEQTFTYDKKAETITVEQKIDDEELVAIFGTDKLTLTFSQQ